MFKRRLYEEHVNIRNREWYSVENIERIQNKIRK